MKINKMILFGLLVFAAATIAQAQNPFGDDTQVTDVQSATPSNVAKINAVPDENVDVKVIAKRQIVDGRECADLGLSVYWATSNIDAANARGYYGRVVAWGELNEKANYTPGTSANYGKARNDIKGNIDYDAATYCWKNGWRMPSFQEVIELRQHCYWMWSEESGRNGYRIVSKINGNYIFLPAVGINRNNGLEEMNVSGYYWTSTPCDNHNSAYRLSFNHKAINLLHGSRYEGCYIRPVHKKTK